MITPDGGTTKKHLILSLNVDTGDINPGWPVDVEATASYNGINFIAEIQQQRPALGIVGNILYVGYGSMRDCCHYHGWLVGVPINNPASVTAWASATHGGAWAALYGPSAVLPAMERTRLLPQVTHLTPVAIGTVAKRLFASSLGPSLAATRAIIGCLQTGSISTAWIWIWVAQAHCWWTCQAQLLPILSLHLGKDRKAYLVNRDNLGGITAPVASATVGESSIIQAAATYRAEQDTYIAFRTTNNNANLSAFRITATNPPTIASGWSVNRDGGGCGSPFVTSTDGTNDMIVWVVGTEDHNTGGDQRLHGYDGATGAVVYDGGGPSELMAATHYYSTTGIVARGRIYVAGDNKVYAFAAPVPTPSPRPTPTPRPHPNPRPRPTPPRLKPKTPYFS